VGRGSLRPGRAAAGDGGPGESEAGLGGGRRRWGRLGIGWPRLSRAVEAGPGGGCDRGSHRWRWCTVRRRRRRRRSAGRQWLGWAGFRRATGSGTCEWAGRAGVGTFSISSSPITFGGPMGKTAESSSIFGSFFLQFSAAVNRPAKIGYNFWQPT
jgi:hypothetical protein